MPAFSADSLQERAGIIDVALDGLGPMYVRETREFVQTVRGAQGPEGPRLEPQGRNLRYAAIVALGLGDKSPQQVQRVLGDDSVEDLLSASATRARSHDDIGAVALCAWASAEVEGVVREDLFAQLDTVIRSDDPVETVPLSWIVTAGAAAARLGRSLTSTEAAARKLQSIQGAAGLYPHAVPARSVGVLREHVGSFADQIYPTQALARLAARNGDAGALEAADRTAARLVSLQGSSGQWWWHYDARTGEVVERFPVYSVHQHGMAPMVLADLRTCGGADHEDAIQRGIGWLDRHPECFEPLVDLEHRVIWRKVGRREPPKAGRRLAAVTTRLRPGLHLPGLDRVFPVGVIDHECRPYELGWLLYAMYRGGRKDLLT